MKKQKVMKLKLKDAYTLLHKGVLALSRAESQGIRIDVHKLQEEEKTLRERINALEEEFLETDFAKDWKKSLHGKKPNLNSSQQLGKFLYDVKGIIPTKVTATGRGSADEEALKSLKIHGVDLLLKRRHLQKIKDTYLAQFVREEVGGYIHPFFHLHTATSYRSSSSNPNFQNIPVREEEANRIIRSLLYPRPDHQLLELDYKSLEVSIAACYNKDQTLINYVRDPKSDMHADVARQIFFLENFEATKEAFKKLRYGAKNGFVFPQFYGDYYKNNAESLVKWVDLEETRWKNGQGLELRPDHPLPEVENYTMSDHFRNNGIKSFGMFVEHIRVIEDHFWNVRFYRYRDWKEKWWREYQQKGYFDTLTGFRCSGVMSRNQVTNIPIQGSAFHCLLWSFTELDRIARKEKWQTKLIGQIHDSILFDVWPLELDHVIQTAKEVSENKIREYWDWIIVPLKIEAELCGVNESWYYKKEIEI